MHDAWGRKTEQVCVPTAKRKDCRDLLSTLSLRSTEYRVPSTVSLFLPCSAKSPPSPPRYIRHVKAASRWSIRKRCVVCLVLFLLIPSVSLVASRHIDGLVSGLFVVVSPPSTALTPECLYSVPDKAMPMPYYQPLAQKLPWFLPAGCATLSLPL